MNVIATHSGGDNLERVIRKAQTARRSTAIAVGFFSSARYQDGTPVAHVAAIHEFGAGAMPERAFFRASARRMEDELAPVLRARIDPQTLQVDNALANELGARGAGIVQTTISHEDYSPRAPNTRETIERKGSSTPLIDTGRMRQSVTWRVYQ